MLLQDRFCLFIMASPIPHFQTSLGLQITSSMISIIFPYFNFHPLISEQPSCMAIEMTPAPKSHVWPLAEQSLHFKACLYAHIWLRGLENKDPFTTCIKDLAWKSWDTFISSVIFFLSVLLRLLIATISQVVIFKMCTLLFFILIHRPLET